MTVTIYNAISLDGFICGPDKYEDWISSADEQYFETTCEAADVILMGSNTFDLNPELYPIPGKENIVFTKTAAERDPVAGITFTDSDPVSVIREHEDKKVLVAGGGKLNATLLKANIVTDITTSIHPIILGAGIHQFEGIDFEAKTKLEKVSQEDIGDDVILVRYKVVD